MSHSFAWVHSSSNFPVIKGTEKLKTACHLDVYYQTFAYDIHELKIMIGRKDCITRELDTACPRRRTHAAFNSEFSALLLCLKLVCRR